MLCNVRNFNIKIFENFALNTFIIWTLITSCLLLLCSVSDFKKLSFVSGLAEFYIEPVCIALILMLVEKKGKGVFKKIAFVLNVIWFMMALIICLFLILLYIYFKYSLYMLPVSD